MASSGKKGKKKGTAISLQTFLSNGGETPAGTTQVSKKIRNVDGDDSDDGSTTLPLVYQLPTAPRASRIFDDDSIPHKPPFIAYVTNLPFDVNEDDIYEFFASTVIVALRLPREDGETGRVRGFGYIEFENREDLIHVLSLPDPCIKGRRIRIELSNEHDQQNNRQRNRRGFEGFGNSGENRDSTDWRRGPNESFDRERGGDRGGDRDRDRGYNRERKQPTDDDNTPGSWRMGSRPAASDSPPRRDYSGEKSRDTNIRNRNFDRDDRERKEPDIQEERPKLNLKPRTLPLPEVTVKPIPDESDDTTIESDQKPKVSGVAPEKVFGAAKPVDTAARELQIEERLAEARKQDSLRREQEQEEVVEKLADVHLEKTDKENANNVISWRRKNDSLSDREDNRKFSPDRSSNSRHITDDRRRDNRDRDYNRFNKPRDRNDKPDSRGKNSQFRDGKPREEAKPRDDAKPREDKKRDKIERPLPKYQPATQPAPVLQTSNKYSGLDDEASE